MKHDNDKRRLRVLLVIESLGGGGAEKVLATLARHIDRERFDITVCTIVDTGKWVDDVRRHVRYRSAIGRPGQSRLGRLWYGIKYRLVYDRLPLKWVYRLFISHGHDVEVAFCEGFATRLLAHSTNRHARRLAWIHCDLHNFHWTRSVFRNDDEEAWCYNQYDRLAAVAQSTTDAFRIEFPTVTTPCRTVYNPIDADDIRRKAQIPADLPQRVPGRLRMVTAGRFSPQKKLDRLLRIVKQLVTEGHNIELWMLGDGELRPQMEQYISEHGLQDIITLWGFKTNPYPYIAAADLFVCSSIAEGYSLVIAESLVLGTPVVSTNCAGPDELLDNGRYGLLTDNDEQALADGIRSLLDHPNRLDHYRHQARLRGDHLGLDTTIRTIEQTLAEERQ